MKKELHFFVWFEELRRDGKFIGCNFSMKMINEGSLTKMPISLTERALGSDIK